MGKRLTCRNCVNYQPAPASGRGARCRFRGGPPAGVCAVFRLAGAQPALSAGTLPTGSSAERE